MHAYTKGVYNKRVLVLGPVPPPYGGVSVHVQRVISLLEQQKNMVLHINSCVEYRYRRVIALFYFIRLFFIIIVFRPQEIHLHTLYVSNGLRDLQIIMLLQTCLNYRVVLVEHDCRYLYKRSSAWKAALHKILPRVNHLVWIGNLTEKSYYDNNMQLPAKCITESAFVPPDRANYDVLIREFPQEMFTFIAHHKPILLANAFQLVLLEGKDLYGFDQCLHVLRQLKNMYPNIGFIFALGQIGDVTYYQQLMHYIKQHALESHCFMLIGQRPLWPLMMHVDLFVRPTLSDGASVSIEEALWSNVPVVASNVCMRPTQVMLYDVYRPNALYNAIKKHLMIVMA